MLVAAEPKLALTGVRAVPAAANDPFRFKVIIVLVLAVPAIRVMFKFLPDPAGFVICRNNEALLLGFGFAW